MLPGVKLQIKFTKAQPSFYLTNNTADSKTTFKFLEAHLQVKRVHPIPPSYRLKLWHWASGPSRGMTRVELKTFTF